jgi:hypothetical protein
VAHRKEPINPFYIILIVVGVAFVVTACAFTLLLLQQNRTTGPSALSSPLMEFLRVRGMLLMGVEVIALGLASTGAMWLDSRRSRRDLATANRGSRPDVEGRS